jgi:signal transduction histidine kinase
VYPGAWAIPLLAAASLALSAIQPGKLPPPFEREDNVLGIAGAAGSSALALALTTAIALLGLVAALDMLGRFRRATGDERQQLKWFAFLAGWGPVLVLVWITVSVLAPDRVFWLDAIFPFFLVSIPVAIGMSVLKYRLYDVDVVINRTLVYGALSACIVAFYALAVGALGAAFRAQGDLAISLVATGVAAVLFQPLRQRLQRGVNRLMYGERDDPYAVLARLGRRLEATLTPDTVLPTIVHTVREALKLPYVAIRLATDPVGDPPAIATAGTAGTAGTPPRETLRLPLVYQHGPVGELLLAPRGPGESFSLTDRRLLDDLSRQAGVAVHAVRLTADLQRSRERLVTAREEERRRLRRDLHDGLGPALASMTLQTEAARELYATDPTRADALLADLTEQLQAAMADIRRLVYELRPPALDELGLVDALRAQAARHELGRTRIRVVAPEALPPLPAAVEVAAYRIAQEALTNVLRHAEAQTCLVTLSYDEPAALLTVAVTDDGCGLPPEPRAGVGLASMRERAEELGGSCSVEPRAGGGTRVWATLPWPALAGEVAR